MTRLLSKPLVEKFAIAGATFGVAAGIIGPSNSGFYLAGIGAGLWLAGMGLLVNE